MPAFGFAPSASASATGAGIALPDYRRPLADELGLYNPTLSVSALATGPDGARYLILDGLRDDEAERDKWAGGYAYAHTSPHGTQLKILGQGTHGQHGAIAVANPPGTAIPESTQVELSWPLPIKRYAAIKGIDDLVNEALGASRILARISFTGDGLREQSLTAYPFIWSDLDIRALYDARANGATQPVEMASRGFRLDVDGATRTLVTDATYAASETFELEVYVRGDRLVNDGTGWIYPSSTPGLLSDDYQAAVEEHWVVAFGMVKGLAQLRKMAMADRGIDRAERAARIGEISLRMTAWGRTAARIRAYETPSPIARPRAGLVGLSTSSGASGTIAVTV